MVGESNQNAYLIQRDVAKYAEFEISEFEISRLDCSSNVNPSIPDSIICAYKL